MQLYIKQLPVVFDNLPNSVLHLRRSCFPKQKTKNYFMPTGTLLSTLPAVRYGTDKGTTKEEKKHREVRRET